MHVVWVNLRHFIITPKPLILRINHKIVLIEIRVSNTAATLKQMDAILTLFVLGMDKSQTIQNRIDILLPQRDTIILVCCAVSNWL